MKIQLKLLTALLSLSIFGILLSSYLTYQHYSILRDSEYQDPLSIFCSPTEKFSCEAVNSSIYSEIYGIPVAAFGLAGFLIYAAVIGYGIANRKNGVKMAVKVVFILSLIGLAFSAYLNYIQLFILNTICPLCEVTAAANLAIFIISILTIRRQ